MLILPLKNISMKKKLVKNMYMMTKLLKPLEKNWIGVMRKIFKLMTMKSIILSYKKMNFCIVSRIMKRVGCYMEMKIADTQNKTTL